MLRLWNSAIYHNPVPEEVGGAELNVVATPACATVAYSAVYGNKQNSFKIISKGVKVELQRIFG